MSIPINAPINLASSNNNGTAGNSGISGGLLNGNGVTIPLLGSNNGTGNVVTNLVDGVTCTVDDLLGSGCTNNTGNLLGNGGTGGLLGNTGGLLGNGGLLDNNGGLLGGNGILSGNGAFVPTTVDDVTCTLDDLLGSGCTNSPNANGGDRPVNDLLGNGIGNVNNTLGGNSSNPNENPVENLLTGVANITNPIAGGVLSLATTPTNGLNLTANLCLLGIGGTVPVNVANPTTSVDPNIFIPCTSSGTTGTLGQIVEPANQTVGNTLSNVVGNTAENPIGPTNFCLLHLVGVGANGALSDDTTGNLAVNIGCPGVAATPPCTGSNCNNPPPCTGANCNTPPPTCTGADCNNPPRCTTNCGNNNGNGGNNGTGNGNGNENNGNGTGTGSVAVTGTGTGNTGTSNNGSSGNGTGTGTGNGNTGTGIGNTGNGNGNAGNGTGTGSGNTGNTGTGSGNNGTGNGNTGSSVPPVGTGVGVGTSSTHTVTTSAMTNTSSNGTGGAVGTVMPQTGHAVSAASGFDFSLLAALLAALGSLFLLGGLALRRQLGQQ